MKTKYSQTSSSKLTSVYSFSLGFLHVRGEISIGEDKDRNTSIPI